MLKIQKTILLLGLLGINLPANANLEYCSGTIKELITRDSNEATYVILNTNNGTSGSAKIGGSNGYTEHEKIQVSMLLAAYMAGKNINIELDTSGYTFNSCESFDTGTPLRFVRFR